MDRPNNLQNINFLLGNGEGLMGDDITFMVCRAQIKLSPEQQKSVKIIDIKGRPIIESVSSEANPKMLQGKLLVDLELLLPGEEGIQQKELIKIALPFQALVKSSRVGEIRPETKYLKVEKIGTDSLLVEAILTLSSLGYQPWRSEAGSRGKFPASSKIKIAQGLPEVNEMVAAQIRFIPSSHSLMGRSLILNGWQETHLIYIGENEEGERVIVTQQMEYFSVHVSLDTELKDLGNLEIQTDKIQNHVLGPYEILVEGEFSLIAGDNVQDVKMSAPEDFLEKIKDMTKMIKENKKPKKVNKEDEYLEKNKEAILAEEIFDEEEKINFVPEILEEEKPDREEKEKPVSAKQAPIVRESKRDRLKKHLRQLKS